MQEDKILLDSLAKDEDLQLYEKVVLGEKKYKIFQRLLKSVEGKKDGK